MRIAADEVVNAQHAGHRGARMLLHTESARAAPLFRGGEGKLGLTGQSDLRAGGEVSHGFFAGEFSRRQAHVHRPRRRHNAQLGRHGKRS